MPQDLLVMLPLLRGPLPSEGAAPWLGALRLWPGLPDPPAAGWFCPAGYAFTPREAAACMADLRRMGEAALSGLPMAALAGNAAMARRETEAALRRGLAAGGGMDAARAAEAACGERLALEQAQKILLWAWAQEESLADLAGLTRQVAEDADGLAAVLGAEADGGAPEALTEDLVRMGEPLAVDAGLAPSWKLVAANALAFLPPEAALAVEGSMRGDVADLLDFTPAPDWDGRLAAMAGGGRRMAVAARAPGWRLLGRSRPTGRAAMDCDRLWLDWRGA